MLLTEYNEEVQNWFINLSRAKQLVPIFLCKPMVNYRLSSLCDMRPETGQTVAKANLLLNTKHLS